MYFAFLFLPDNFFSVRAGLPSTSTTAQAQNVKQRQRNTSSHSKKEDGKKKDRNARGEIGWRG